MAQRFIYVYISYFCEIQIIFMEVSYTVEQIKLARFAKAMGHPARIKILENTPWLREQVELVRH